MVRSAGIVDPDSAVFQTQLIVNLLLFQKRKHEHEPAGAGFRCLVGSLAPGRTEPVSVAAQSTRWVDTMRGFVVGRRQTDLFQLVRASDAPCRFSRRLNGRQQQRHNDRDDGDHY